MTDLFSGPYPNAPGWKESTTSREAAQQIERTGRANTLREEIKHRIIGGWQGTADEMAALLNESALAVRPRFSELRQLKWIMPTGERRTNESGASATVWKWQE